MFNNLKIDKLYKFYYKNNNFEYFSFGKKNLSECLCDVFTQKIYYINDILAIETNEIDENSSEFKFYKKEFKINNFSDIFLKKIPNDEFLLPNNYHRILRFFDISYNDLHDDTPNNKNCEILKDKIKKYVKKYYNQYLYESYCTQLNYLNTIPCILSFSPREIQQEGELFWSIDYIGCKKFKHFLFGLDMDWCRAFNKNNLNWVLLHENKNLYLSEMENTLNIIKQKYKDEFFEKIPKILNERLQTGLFTLQNEEQKAQESNNNDSLIEINIIKEILLNVQNTFDFSLKNIDFEKDLTEFWPEILLPIPHEENFEFYYDYIKFKELLNWVYVRNSN